MTRPINLRIILCLFVLLFTGCGGSGQDQTVGFAGETPSVKFQRLVEEAALNHATPAIAAGLWMPGQEPRVVLQGQADRAGVRVLAREDRFRIGSVSKSFTVTVLLQLVDEGRVNLDDPISKFFPNTSNGTATLEQLANMTSGIFNYTEDQQFLLAFINDFDKALSPQDLLEASERGTPHFTPGSSWRYSNTNTVLLGLVIEQVTGNTLAQEIQTRILGPLNMTGTSYPVDANMPVPFAKGYSLFDRDDPLVETSRVHPSASAGSGALVSNLDDLRIWAKALAEGSLLKPETFARQIRFVPTLAEVNSPEYESYGMGIGTLSGWRGHTGDYIGFQALVMSDPETGAVVVILVNLKNLTQPGHLPTEIFENFVAGI